MVAPVWWPIGLEGAQAVYLMRELRTCGGRKPMLYYTKELIRTLQQLQERLETEENK